LTSSHVEKSFDELAHESHDGSGFAATVSSDFGFVPGVHDRVTSTPTVHGQPKVLASSTRAVLGNTQAALILSAALLLQIQAASFEVCAGARKAPRVTDLGDENSGGRLSDRRSQCFGRASDGFARAH
jgi:hypothetical protein